MVAGDIVHEFPSADPAFYEDNTTSMDRAAEIYAGFDFPAYFALGNHDYEVPALPRELTWDLVRSKWNMDRTWQAVDVGGTRWLLLDGQFGPTWDPEDTLYDRDFASFGDEQLAWVDAQLSEGLPTFLVFHHPPNFVRVNESSGAFPDLFALVASHGDTVEGIFTGHMHLWMDTSSMWERPGYGLAATRYDARNWWVMDIDLTTGDWAIPRSSMPRSGSTANSRKRRPCDGCPSPKTSESSPIWSGRASRQRAGTAEPFAMSPDKASRPGARRRDNGITS
jgi:hypothetical protein